MVWSYSVSLCSPGYLGTLYVDKAGFKLTDIHLPLCLSNAGIPLTPRECMCVESNIHKEGEIGNAERRDIFCDYRLSGLDETHVLHKRRAGMVSPTNGSRVHWCRCEQ